MLAQQSVQLQTDLKGGGLIESVLPGKYSIIRLIKPRERLNNTDEQNG